MRSNPTTRIVAALVLTFLIAPLLVVVVASFDTGPFFQFPPHDVGLFWFEQLAASPEWRDSVTFSLLIAFTSAGISTAIGLLGGIAIARLSPRWSVVWRGVSVAPMVVPTIVIAIGVYPWFLRSGFIGGAGPFILVNVLLTVPLTTLFVTSAMAAVDKSVEHASLSCGAGVSRTLITVIIPLVLPAALAGGVTAFMLSLEEVVISSFLVAPRSVPLAVRMLGEIEDGSTPFVTAMATVLIVFASVFVVLAAVRGNEKLLRGGR